MLSASISKYGTLARVEKGAGIGAAAKTCQHQAIGPMLAYRINVSPWCGDG